MEFDLKDKLLRREKKEQGESASERKNAPEKERASKGESSSEEEAASLDEEALAREEDSLRETAEDKFEAELAAAESLKQLSEAEKASLEKNLSRLEQFALRLEQTKIAEYMDYLADPRRLIRMNFLMGLARGFGFAVGLTVLSALVLYILQMVIRLNLPVISKFIADILIYANEYLKLYKFPA
ncbi:MAG: DUF5665 domain-containing protein [Peptococcaceae bacterium]|nr:DUF5665 domain-containing protein [Peptococcaceae bacterium]